MKVFLAVIALLMAAAAFAVVPPTMTYQGIFMDAEGNVMPDGDYEVGFHIFGGPGGGPPDWTEYRTIHVENGLFEIVLGETVPMNPAFIRPTGTWLGLTYNQIFLEPRQPMNSVAYSFRTCWADSAFGAATLGIHTPVTISEFQDSTRTRLDLLEECCDSTSARLDTVEADIDTLKERVTDLEEGGGGGDVTGTGAFRDFENVDFDADNFSTDYDSDSFSVTGDGVLLSCQVVTEGGSGDVLRGRIQLIRADDDFVVSTSLTMKAVGGADLHLQNVDPDAGPDEYYIRVTLWTEGEEAFTSIDFLEFGAMWVPVPEER